MSDVSQIHWFDHSCSCCRDIRIKYCPNKAKYDRCGMCNEVHYHGSLERATTIANQAGDESILQEAQRLIFGDRRQEYGHPLDDYTRTAGMVNACFAHILKRPFTAEEIMMVMVLVKLSRYQETAKRDTLVDMAGYCGTIGEATAERIRRATQAQGQNRESEQREK